MADEDWGDGATTVSQFTAIKSDDNNNIDSNNNENSNNNNNGFESKKGFSKGFGGGNDGGDGRSGFSGRGGRGGFNRNREGGDNRGFRSNNNDNGGERRGGFNRNNNDGEGGGFGGGGRGGFSNRGGSGGGGFSSFRKRHESDGDNNNSGNGEGSSEGGRGFNKGGFRNNDDNRGGGERRGGGGFGRNNDNNGGGDRGFNNRRGSDGDGGDGGGGGGGERRGFGNRSNNDENRGGGRSFNNDNNGGGGRGFSKRDGDDNNGGGGRGFFKRDGDDNNGGGGRGFNNGGGERRGGFNGGRNNSDGDGNKGFGSFRRNENGGDGGGERRGFGGDGGGGRSFKSRDENGGGGGEGRRFNRDRDDNGGGGGGRGGGFGRRDSSRGEDGGGDGGFRRRDRSAPGGGEDGGDAPARERYIPEMKDDEDSLFHTIDAGVNFKKQAEIPANLSGEGSEEIKPIESFNEANLSDLLLENITKSKYEIPTPVQKYSIPIILARRDLMACAQTGSGKTAAYLVPILTNILKDGIQSSELSHIQTPQALIISPTRELAIQIYKEAKRFSYHSIIKTQILYGGTVVGHQLSELSKGANVVVATPGRLLDIINKGKLSLEKVKYIVLDEADRMLDQGFEVAVREILSKCVMEQAERHIFMFSATFPKDIQKLAQDFLQKNYLFLTIGFVGGANSDVSQNIIKVDDKFKKRDELLNILNDIGSERTMVFVEHKKQADVLAFFLLQRGYPTTSIHGDRLQSQREAALKDFKSGDAKIIICTSVAARGLDISDVKYVVNYDLPQTIDEYVHRIGRTGRCGNLGKSVSFFDSTSDNDRKLARSLCTILTQASQEPPAWLMDIGEDAGGSRWDGARKDDDIRDKFQSIAIGEKVSAPAAPVANDTEDW